MMGGEPDFSYVEGMAGTRHLVLFDISKRLLAIEQQSESLDSECDRALSEIWRLARWVEARIQRNSAGC